MAALITFSLLCLKYESETNRDRHEELLMFRKLHPKNINLCGTNLRKLICGTNFYNF